MSATHIFIVNNQLNFGFGDIEANKKLSLATKSQIQTAIKNKDPFIEELEYKEALYLADGIFFVSEFDF